MKFLTVIVLVFACFAAALSVGQYYVPRSYYIIDETGRATDPVPMHRLRRSLAEQRPWIGSLINKEVADRLNGETHRMTL